MTTTTSRFGRTIANLLLALLNATLILVAVCLYLEWRVVRAVDGLTETFSQNLIEVTPLRNSVEALTQETIALRQDLAALAEAPQEYVAERATALDAKVQKLSLNLAAIKQEIGIVIQNPEVMVDHAIEKTAQELIDGLANLRGCEMPEST